MLERIEALKTFGGRTLAAALNGADLDGLSEAGLRSAWLVELQKNESIHASGWYTPPPDGILMAFGSPADGYGRIAQPSFRPEVMWPSDIRFNRETDVMMAYASPVCRRSHMIGDFGTSLYFGNEARIREHFIAVARVYRTILDYIAPGMMFSDIYRFAMAEINRRGMDNEIESTTDLAGTNIGHTIPLSFADDPAHEAVAQAVNRDEIYAAISKGRIFVNALEEKRVEDNMAFTIEPRLASAGMPRIYFHTTVIVEAGRVRAVNGFSDLDNACMKDVIKELTE